MGTLSVVLTQVALQIGQLGASFPASLSADPVIAVVLGAALLGETVPTAPLAGAGLRRLPGRDRRRRYPIGARGRSLTAGRSWPSSHQAAAKASRQAATATPNPAVTASAARCNCGFAAWVPPWK